MNRFIQGILGAALLLLGTAIAQNTQSSQESYRYDASTQTTIKGVVLDVKEYQCPVSGTLGTHITLKTDSGPIEVHLAPAKFVKLYEIEIKKGDTVAIQGSRITFEGKPSLLAKVVSIDNVTYAFRDNNGKPLW